ncbi:MAG: DUF99 family protein [Candidatus Thorarchaeota archaeon]|nr:DUF99 family protein [Candidatus Thorarchaeota archaeon]
MPSVHKILPDHPTRARIQWKEGIRVLGVSESFQKGERKSYVAGVVMRGDLRIDGFSFCSPTVGGLDSTESLLEMYDRLHRQDIKAWLLGGSIISWFNPIDIHLLAKETEIPVVCVSYWPSEGLEKYVREYFPNDWEHRMSRIDALGNRQEITMDHGYSVFIVMADIDLRSATSLVEHFTHNGRVPEPIRVARQLAASFRQYQTDFRGE